MTEPTAPVAAPAGRVRLAVYAAAQVGLAFLALLAFILLVLGSALVVVWVGIVLLVVAVPLTRWLAQLHRRMAARVLGVTVPTPYRALPRGSRLAALDTIARDR